MEYTKIVESIASGLGTDAGEFSEALIKEGENSQLDLEKLSGLLSKVTKDRIIKVSGESRDEGYGRAKKETMEQLESRLAEKYGVEKTRFDDMLDGIITKQKETFKANPNDIRNSDVYLNDIKAEQKKAEELRKDFETKQQGWKREQVQLLGQSRAQRYLEDSNFSLPEDQTKKDNLIKLFLNDVFNNPETRIEPEGGNLKILDKDGYPIRNEMKEEINFDDFLEAKATMYFEKRNDRKPASTGNHREGTQQTDQIAVPDFSSADEFIGLIQEAVKSGDKEKVAALKSKYDAKVKSGEITE